MEGMRERSKQDANPGWPPLVHGPRIYTAGPRQAYTKPHRTGTAAVAAIAHREPVQDRRAATRLTRQVTERWDSVSAIFSFVCVPSAVDASEARPRIGNA